MSRYLEGNPANFLYLSNLYCRKKNEQKMKKVLIFAFPIMFLNIIILFSAEKRDRIVLSFDNRHPYRIKKITSPLAEINGVVANFVKNQRVHSGYLCFEYLRSLQNIYKREINTYFSHHFLSLRYEEKYGIQKRVYDKFKVSVKEFESNGIKKIMSLVFPFNSFTLFPKLLRYSNKKVINEN